jgi:hypothetical protein
MKNNIFRIKQGIILLLLIIGFMNLNAQELVFSNAFSIENSLSNSTNETVIGIDVDVDGNQYVSGYFRGTVDFDPGAGVTNLVAPNTSDNAFIAKYDATGALVFAKMIHATTASAVRGNDIKVDADGNIYFVILASATATVDITSIGGTTFTGSSLSLIKLDATGNLVWIKRSNGPTSDLTANILTFDSNQSNILVTGRYPGPSTFDVGGANVVLNTTAGSNAFILKYTAAGAFQWVKDFRSSTGSTWGTQMSADSNNNIYATGFFNTATNFGGGINMTPTGGSGEDVFVAKLDVSGNTLWAFKIGSATNDRGMAIKVDADNNIIAGGRFTQTADFNPNGTPELRTSAAGVGSTFTDAYLAKYDPNGLLIWVHTFGQATGGESISKIAMDPNGELYAGGIFFNTVDFDPSTDDFFLTSGGSADVFVLNLTSNGDFIHAVNFEGNAFDWLNSLAFDTFSNHLYISGAYRGTVDFDPGVGVFNLVNPSTSSDNGFVVNLEKTIPTDTVPEIFCPENIIVGSNPDVCGAEVFFADATAIDFEDGNISVTQTLGLPSGSLFPLGDSVIEFTTTDSDGNSATCQFTITVIDDVPPVFTTQNITIALDENGFAFIEYEDVLDGPAIDICGGIQTGAVDIEEFTCSDIGNPVLVTVFVMDTNGNIASDTAVVTVVDLLGPVIDCPANMTVDTDAGSITFTVPDYVGDGLISVTDNCTDPVTVYSQTPAPGTLLLDGTYTVTIDAEDEYGNTSTCSFQLTVDTILGLNENELNAAIVMYPNPANAFVNLRNNSAIALTEATIYDLSGKLVSKVDLSQMSGEQQIDVSSLASGVYMVNISSERATVVKRLIKK